MSSTLCSFTVVSTGWSLFLLFALLPQLATFRVFSRSVGVSLGLFDCTSGLDFSRILFASVPRQDSRTRRCQFRIGQCLRCLSSAREPGRGWLSVLLYFSVCTVCHAFGLWDCPGLPLLLSAQTCNTVFLASWACACRASCGLAHLIPKNLFEFLCWCSNRSLACVALLASELPLDCPRTAVPTVCLSYS